jgi:methionyl-tRNA formyltransferase
VKTLLVTSRVTFVPENYGRFVVPLAKNANMSAILFLENRDLKTLAMGSAFFASRLAPGIGAELIKNTLVSLDDPRERAWRESGKKVYCASQINSDGCLEILKNFDLVLNARTRFIYKKAALDAPRLGCINIHHGLLPEQRGLFCDLWAQVEGRPAGFSIHRMTPKLDDGEILGRFEVPVKPGRRFVDHALASSEYEMAAIQNQLEMIKEVDRIEGQPNLRTANTRYFSNPTVSQIREFKKKGFSL